MLSLLWWLPLAVGAAAIYPLWRGARGLRGEAEQLRSAVAGLATVRPLVAQLNQEIAAVDQARRGIADLGHR